MLTDGTTSKTGLEKHAHETFKSQYVKKKKKAASVSASQPQFGSLI